MRILIWSFVPPSPESAYWHWLKGGIEAVGHQVIAVDAFALAEIFGPDQMEAILLAYARAYRVQAAVVVPQNFVTTRFLQALRAMGVVLVSFRYDDGMIAAPGCPPVSGTLARIYTYADAHCDLSVSFCRGSGPLFASLGCPSPVYLPLPWGWQATEADEAPLRPVVAYAGSPKYAPQAALSARVTVVQALLAAGLPVELHHDGWKDVPGCEEAARPTPTLREFYGVFRTSAVNLCIASDWGPQIHSMIKNLHLEIASAGGMLLTTPCQELDDYFTAGESIAYANSLEEFVTQARYYLAHPDEARRLGRQARRAVEARAGWDRWWQAVADRLADRGILLALDAPHLEPDPAELATLQMAAGALAHAHERAGETVLAEVYYRELLHYDPANFTAHRGLARLSGDNATARHHLSQAIAATTITQTVQPPRRLGWPGIGPEGAQFAIDAAIEQGRLAVNDNDWPSLMQALSVLCAYRADVAPNTANWLLKQGETDIAIRVLDAGLAFWPDDATTLNLRGDLAFDQGLFLEAEAFWQRAKEPGAAT